MGNTIVVGGLAAIGMTLLNELPNFRIRRLQVDLSEASLPAVDNFLSRFADSHSWTEKGKARLRLVGEEVLLSLLEEENDGQAEQKREWSPQFALKAIQPSWRSWLLRTTPSKEISKAACCTWTRDRHWRTIKECPSAFLRQYASSVHHRQYYGVDIITCRVMDE